MTMPLDEDATPKKDLDPNKLGEQATATGAEMKNARLGGVEGVGTLQVVRGNSREVVDIAGTWRSKDVSEDGGKLSGLIEAAESGKTVEYEGPLVDPEGSKDNFKVEVEITSSNRYEYGAEDEDDEEGPHRRVFNFQPAEGKNAL